MKSRFPSAALAAPKKWRTRCSSSRARRAATSPAKRCPSPEAGTKAHGQPPHPYPSPPGERGTRYAPRPLGERGRGEEAAARGEFLCLATPQPPPRAPVSRAAPPPSLDAVIHTAWQTTEQFLASAPSR